ncbi:DUF255 domain-containing protein [Anaeromassilibacillus senegalensis]|uniref:DUF255 domain-containing protein n=2 Tax=Anaeromassilibacillus senegalensis TaxID=1673717 RepID=A0ABS9CM04_9FIRM|nr:DUF255 domain-containing protein [Anaeromassilibacillus senegalensis]
MANALQFEQSPYLLQHAENPVDWQPWGAAAFEEAKRRDLPVFLSIGYSTCHWCHVMAHESFESEEVAAVLNRFFIPVKVDREERPDVDAVYMPHFEKTLYDNALLTLLETLWPTAELVCTAEKLPAELLTFLREKPRTGLSVLMKTAENQTRLAALAPFTAAYSIPPDGARYYLCWGKACLNPVKTIEELKKLLS